MAGESDARRKKILKDLTERSWTLKELVQRYGAGESSIKHDIIGLRKQGYQILGGGKKGYRLLSDAEEEVQLVFMESLRKDHLSRLTLLLLIQREEKPLTVREICDRYMRNAYHGLSGDNLRTERQLMSRLSRTLLPSMLEEHLLEETEDGRYYVSEQAPVTLPLLVTDAYDILDQLHYFGPAHPFAGDLRSVEEKLSITLTDRKDPERDDSYRMIGKKDIEDGRVLSDLERIQDLPLSEYAFHARFHTRSGEEKELDFYPGLLCYAADKNSLFLIGRDFSGKDMILRLDRVEELTPREEKNHRYQSPYYLEMYEEMFSVSTEPVQHVVVEFDHLFSIRDKLQRMMQHRNHATLRVKGDTMVYEDDIRGLEDFSKYLRQYGKSARVLEPEELRLKMLRSAEMTLKRYEEVYS